MKECNICNKKLPHHIFDGHMRKWHSDTLESTSGTPSLKKTQESRFDYQKSETCGSCGEVHPAILMRYHAHVQHGV